VESIELACTRLEPEGADGRLALKVVFEASSPEIAEGTELVLLLRNEDLGKHFRVGQHWIMEERDAERRSASAAPRRRKAG
jgi:hypothetical protein